MKKRWERVVCRNSSADSNFSVCKLKEEARETNDEEMGKDVLGNSYSWRRALYILKSLGKRRIKQ